MISSLRKDAVFDTCPQCNSVAKLRRSRAQGFFERLVKKSGFLNMYRCTSCGWRGIKSNFSIRKIKPKIIFYYLILMLFVAIIVRFVVIKFLIK
ncbi:MAG: hypothetical protein CVV23_14270 [Ignavibacteriae bacterium HGW-Ignavibacteriae-2]|nr:MAG: hypothetical protein CVV23_14270 [Ignavibacteriae bacterium HGW-Ignavibacteriae-2]